MADVRITTPRSNYLPIGYGTPVNVHDQPGLPPGLKVLLPCGCQVRQWNGHMSYWYVIVKGESCDTGYHELGNSFYVEEYDEHEGQYLGPPCVGSNSNVITFTAEEYNAMRSEGVNWIERNRIAPEMENFVWPQT